MATKRICICCKKEYEYCPSCGNKSQPWKFNYDTEECRDLFNVLSGYNMGLMGLEKVKEVVKQYNITDLNKYKEPIRNMLNKILGKGGHATLVESPIEEVNIPDVVETSVVSDISEVVEIVPEVEEEPKVEETIEEKPKYVSNAKRRRSRFFEQ